MKGTVIFAATALLAMPLQAQERPAQLQPTRDVSVVYRSTTQAGSSAQQEVRVEWNVAAGKIRIDPQGGMAWILVDRQASSVVMVLDAQQSVMDMGPAMLAGVTAGPPDDARFTRKGTGRVAGHACTEWEMRSSKGPGTLCLTDDGVTLRAEGVEASLLLNGLEATQLRYGSPDPDRFVVPRDYRFIPSNPAPPR